VVSALVLSCSLLALVNTEMCGLFVGKAFPYITNHSGHFSLPSLLDKWFEY